MSHAAKAFEECDRSFKPVFARPKESKSNRENRDRDMSYSSNGHYDSYDRFGPSMTSSFLDSYSGFGGKHLKYHLKCLCVFNCVMFKQIIDLHMIFQSHFNSAP